MDCFGACLVALRGPSARNVGEAFIRCSRPIVRGVAFPARTTAQEASREECLCGFQPTSRVGARLHQPAAGRHTATAAEVQVMISGGLAAAYKALVPEFERATGHKVLTAYGPSMGTTTNAIPVRLERGEAADVLIMVGYAIDDLANKGKVIPDSRVDLVKSPIGVAVKSGAPKPDISTRMRSSARCSRRKPSPIPTAPAASMSRPRCSTSSASRKR